MKGLGGTGNKAEVTGRGQNLQSLLDLQSTESEK